MHSLESSAIKEMCLISMCLTLMIYVVELTLRIIFLFQLTNMKGHFKAILTPQRPTFLKLFCHKGLIFQGFWLYSLVITTTRFHITTIPYEMRFIPH